MKKSTILLKIAMAISVLFYIPSSLSQSNNKDVWVTEEILQQLQDLNQVVASLKSEVKVLGEKIDRMPSPQKPAGQVSRIDLGDGYFLGDKDAPYAIIEFMDYECPFCVRHALNVFPEIKKAFIDTGKLKYVIRDFPLASHQKALGAAVAANCAGEQGRYWQAHDTLIENRRKFSREFYLSMAADLKLDQSEYETCLDLPAQRLSVEESLRAGQEMGVTGTPKFFLGKTEGQALIDIKVISGAQPFSSFKRYIDKQKN